MPLAATLRSAVSFQDVQLIQEASKLAQDAHHDSEGDGYVESRRFGVGKNITAGHTVTYVHDHIHLVDSALLDRLLALAPGLVEKGGWLHVDSLRVRCVEVIQYEGGKESEQNIGWHTDGATLLTIAAMLSNKTAYEGGRINLRSEDGMRSEQHELDAGDIIAWRGWTDHQVQAVTAGRREVLVLEVWAGDDVRESELQRDVDNPDALREAVKVDPTSAQVHRLLGKSLCRSLPCVSPEIAQEAEIAFREALRLQPEHASVRHSLATFLAGSFRFWADGVSHFHASCVMDPDRRFSAYYCPFWSIYLACYQFGKANLARAGSLHLDTTEPNSPTESLEEVFQRVTQAATVIIMLAVLVPLVFYLDKQDRAAAKKVASIPCVKVD